MPYYSVASYDSIVSLRHTSSPSGTMEVREGRADLRPGVDVLLFLRYSPSSQSCSTLLKARVGSGHSSSSTAAARSRASSSSSWCSRASSASSRLASRLASRLLTLTPGVSMMTGIVTRESAAASATFQPRSRPGGGREICEISLLIVKIARNVLSIVLKLILFSSRTCREIFFHRTRSERESWLSSSLFEFSLLQKM